MAAAIQDLTYVSQVREENGVTQKGFRVFVGGGTSIHAAAGPSPCTSFVPESEYLRVALAIWTVFNNADILRKKPHDGPGSRCSSTRSALTAFRELVDAELENIGPIDPHRF